MELMPVDVAFVALCELLLHGFMLYFINISTMINVASSSWNVGRLLVAFASNDYL